MEVGETLEVVFGHSLTTVVIGIEMVQVLAALCVTKLLHDFRFLYLSMAIHFVTVVCHLVGK